MPCGYKTSLFRFNMEQIHIHCQYREEKQQTVCDIALRQE